MPHALYSLIPTTPPISSTGLMANRIENLGLGDFGFTAWLKGVYGLIIQGFRHLGFQGLKFRVWGFRA